MFRSLAGPYRKAYLMLLAGTMASAFLMSVMDVVRNGARALNLGTVSYFALTMIMGVFGFYLVFRTGSAHWVRIRKDDSRMDIVGPVVIIGFWLSVFLLMPFISAEVMDRFAFAVPILMVMFIWGFGVAGRKLTELRGFEKNFGATLGWGLVHFYWIIGIFLILQHTRLDGPTLKSDHP
ncbi:MAG: hypothetical protein ACSHX3_03515 [Litorimonas sp.]